MSERLWSMRPMTAEDFPLVRELYQAVRSTNRPEAYDRWRLVDNPVAFPPAVLAIHEGKCVGLYLLWPTRLQLGSEVVLGAQSVDTMTHPDYRNQGMFTALAEQCFQLAENCDFEVLYGFPNPLSYPGFIRRLNWDHSGDVRHWVRVIRPSHFQRIPSLLRPAADVCAHLLPTGIPRGIEVSTTPPSQEELDALLDEWNSRKELCRVSRDPEWLRWRYAAASGMYYEWLTARRGGKTVACGLWGIRGPDWTEQMDGRAKLVETLGSDRDGLAAIIGTAITRAHDCGAWMIETLTNLEPVSNLLIRAGFISHRRAPFIVRSLTTRILGANIHTHSAWRIVGGDVDTF